MLTNNSSVSPIVVSFSSRNRSSGNNSNFISNPVNLGVNKYDSVCLLQASIPRSFYNINVPYNIFYLNEGALRVPIVIPPASYNNINVCKVITDLLNASSPNGWIYEMFYNNSTWKCGDPDIFKFYWSVSGNSGTQPMFEFDNDSMNRQLGFEVESFNYFIGDSLISTVAINMSYITRAFIKSDVVINSYNSILEEILNYGDYGSQSLCYYQQPSVELNSRAYANTGINSFQFTLVDSFDNLIDLNGIPWSFSLVFYQRNDLFELQKLELQIQNELRMMDIQNKQNQIVKQVNASPRPSPALIDGSLEGVVSGTTLGVSIPSEVSDLGRPEDTVPIFPVKPFGSSFALEDITLDNERVLPGLS